MPKNKNRLILSIIIVVILIAVVALVFLLTRPQSIIIIVVPEHYFTIPPGEGAEYNLTVPQGYNAILNGEFVSSNNLEVAVLNDSQMTAFTNFRIATDFNKTYNNLSSAVSYTFNATDNSKAVVVDVINLRLSPGRYHLLFYNPNPEYLNKAQNLTYWANVSMATPIVLNYTR
jgi:hypothetical protein